MNEQSKTHWKKLTNPNYLGSWDVEKDSLEVTVNEIVTEDFYVPGEGDSSGVVMYFKEKDKGMILNKTNLKAMESITGSSYVEDWIDQKILLKVDKVKAFGEVVDALRIHKYSKQKITAKRFEAALEAIKANKYSKEKLVNEFELSKEQFKTLENGK